MLFNRVNGKCQKNTALVLRYTFDSGKKSLQRKWLFLKSSCFLCQNCVRCLSNEYKTLPAWGGLFLLLLLSGARSSFSMSRERVDLCS